MERGGVLSPNLFVPLLEPIALLHEPIALLHERCIKALLVLFGCRELLVGSKSQFAARFLKLYIQSYLILSDFTREREGGCLRRSPWIQGEEQGGLARAYEPVAALQRDRRLLKSIPMAL